MTGMIPFARESWVAVNLYALRTDGRQTLTLDGKPPPNYSPDETVAYLDKYEPVPTSSGSEARSTASRPTNRRHQTWSRQWSRP